MRAIPHALTLVALVLVLVATVSASSVLTRIASTVITTASAARSEGVVFRLYSLMKAAVEHYSSNGKG